TLTGYVAFCRAFRPIGGSPPERQSRVGLAAGGPEIVRGCSVPPEEKTQPARPDPTRDPKTPRAFTSRPFRKHHSPIFIKIFLRNNLCSRKRGNCNEHGKTSHEAQSNRHRILPSAMDARLCHGFPILRCKTDNRKRVASGAPADRLTDCASKNLICM